MKKIYLLFILVLTSWSAYSQTDWSWWNETHGWESGMPGWRSFITISPGYLGPNALPVAQVKKGLLSDQKEVEISSNFHFRKGDPTQNISGRFFYPFAENKIAIEIYGVMLEHYEMSPEVRDERAARDKDGRGLAVGDLYFSTQIQLWKNRKFPNTLLRMTGKTASGGRIDAARYADSPGYFFDLSFSKEYQCKFDWSFMPFTSFGFYSWQTNDDENLQNDAYMYSAGFDLGNGKWNFSNSLAGYSGYKVERDKPMVYNVEIKRKLVEDAIRVQFTYGIRDWDYKTITFAYIWQWD